MAKKPATMKQQRIVEIKALQLEIKALCEKIEKAGAGNHVFGGGHISEFEYYAPRELRVLERDGTSSDRSLTETERKNRNLVNREARLAISMAEKELVKWEADRPRRERKTARAKWAVGVMLGHIDPNDLSKRPAL